MCLEENAMAPGDGMVNGPNADNVDMIADEEAEIYDRQIRLWGASAQKRIRTIRVLAIGATSVGVETCKNLILSGIKSLVVNDPEIVTEKEVEANFFLDPASVGKIRSKAVLPGLQDLSTHVAVRAEEGSLADKPLSFFAQFDAVVVTNQSIANVKILNDACSYYKIRFFWVEVFGYFGYIYHGYNDWTANMKKSRNSSFVDLMTWDSSDADLKSPKCKHETLSLLALRVFMEFFSVNGRKPLWDSDADEMLKICKRILRDPADAELLPIETEMEEFGPSCVVVGACLADDLLKAFYKRVPHNVKIFNARCSEGTSIVFTTNLSLSYGIGCPAENIIDCIDIEVE